MHMRTSSSPTLCPLERSRGVGCSGGKGKGSREEHMPSARAAGLPARGRQREGAQHYVTSSGLKGGQATKATDKQTHPPLRGGRGHAPPSSPRRSRPPASRILKLVVEENLGRHIIKENKRERKREENKEAEKEEKEEEEEKKGVEER